MATLHVCPRCGESFRLEHAPTARKVSCPHCGAVVDEPVSARLHGKTGDLSAGSEGAAVDDLLPPSAGGDLLPPSAAGARHGSAARGPTAPLVPDMAEMPDAVDDLLPPTAIAEDSSSLADLLPPTAGIASAMPGGPSAITPAPAGTGPLRNMPIGNMSAESGRDVDALLPPGALSGGDVDSLLPPVALPPSGGPSAAESAVEPAPALQQPEDFPAFSILPSGISAAMRERRRRRRVQNLVMLILSLILLGFSLAVLIKVKSSGPSQEVDQASSLPMR